MEAAGVSESWSVPAGEFGEAAGLFDEFWARSKNEMIGVSEDRLAAELAHFGVRDSFDAGTSGSTDEGGCFNIAVRGMNDAGAHKAGLFLDFKDGILF